MLMAKFKSLSSLHLALIAIMICALRWVFVANGYDYGWDYETGYRVYSGGIYGRDFYTALGPLSYGLIGLVFKVLGPKWFWVYPLYYSCWILTLLGVWVLFKNLTNQLEFLAIVLMGIAPLSIPHINALHFYNCLGYCLAIWSSSFCFIYFKKGQYRFLFLAGICAALALFTKQNLGLGVALLNLVLLFLDLVVSKKKPLKMFLVSLFAWSVPFFSLSAVMFYFFSREIGLSELFRLMFTDAAQAKGNLFTMLKVAIPRISFGHSEKRDSLWLIQHLAEAASYLVILSVNYFAVRRLLSAGSQKVNEKHSVADLKFVRLVFVAFLFVLILPTMIPEPVYFIRAKYFWLNQKKQISPILLPFFFWLMIVNLFCCAWVDLKRNQRFGEEQRTFFMLGILAIGMNVLVCASKFSYLFLNVPLLLSLVLLMNLKIGLWDRKQWLTLLVALWMGAYFFYPTHSLSRLTKLRGDNLDWLLFADSDRDFVEFYTEKVKPYVQNKRTLWLIHGGPHSLSGGIPVRNVSNLYFDQFSLRIEESLVKDWMAHPPEVVVMDWFVTPERSIWLRGKAFQDWLDENYVQVAKINNKRILSLNH